MKSKTLIAAALASTFGWAAAAHAGSGHENSAAKDAQHSAPMAMYESRGSESRLGSTMPGADTGLYPEYYIVSGTPIEASQADSYVITDDYFVLLEPSEALLMRDDGASSDLVLMLDDGPYILSTYEVILLPGDFEESNWRPGVASEEPAG